MFCNEYKVLKSTDRYRDPEDPEIELVLCLAKMLPEDKNYKENGLTYFTYFEVYEGEESKKLNEPTHGVRPLWSKSYEKAKENFLTRKVNLENKK